MTESGALEAVLISIARVAWNLLFLTSAHPFIIGVGGLLLDGVDVDIIRDGTELTSIQYQLVDKGLDVVGTIAATFYFIYYWRRLWYGRIVVPFLIYRTIGVIVFLAVRERFILAIFPDVGGLLFLFYTGLDIVRLDYTVRHNLATFIILVVFIPFKVASEVLHHVFINPSPIFILLFLVGLVIYIGWFMKANFDTKPFPFSPLLSPLGKMKPFPSGLTFIWVEKDGNVIPEKKKVRGKTIH